MTVFKKKRFKIRYVIVNLILIESIKYDDFKDKMVETKHTNQRFKIDSISFDKTPKNTSFLYENILRNKQIYIAFVPPERRRTLSR